MSTIRSNSISSTHTNSNLPKVGELRTKFREAWSLGVDTQGRLSSKDLLMVLQALNCFSTTINVGKREAPRYVTFNATPNDVVFLLKSLGYSDHEIATHVYLDYKTLENWYINQVLGFQGQKLNVLLTRHTLSKPRMGYHKLPPGDILYGNNSAYLNKDNLKIKDLVEGNYAKPAEKRPPSQWPPRRPGSAADDGKRHGANSQTKKQDDLWMLMSYGYAPVMGKGLEHNYAPHENTKTFGKLPTPRPTLSSTLKAEAVKHTYTERETYSRPQSAKQDINWKLPEFTENITPRTRLDGYPLDYEQKFPSRTLNTARSSLTNNNGSFSGRKNSGSAFSRRSSNVSNGTAQLSIVGNNNQRPYSARV